MNHFSYVTELKDTDIGLVGTPVVVPYVGNHDTVTAYGSLTQQMVESFSGRTIASTQ